MSRDRVMRRRADSSSSGSVSIYFIAATAAFVLLTGLLIDFARMAAFRKQTELAVQAGVRSVLSSYDPEMYERYGLFIRGGEAGDDIFRTIVEGHGMNRSSGDIFPYLDAEWRDAGIAESRPLADHGVFRRQVMEEMKYKAPIDLTLELADRFRGLSPPLKEAANTVSVLEKMRVSYDRREARLDEALESQEQAGGQLASLLRNAADPFPPAREEDGSTPPGVFDWAVAAGRIRSTAEESGSRAITAWRLAWEANEEMIAVSSSPSPGRDPQTPEAPVDAGTIKSLTELRDSAKQLTLSAAFFDDYAKELQLQKQKGMQLAEQIDRLSSILTDEPSNPASADGWRIAAMELDRRLTEYEAAYGTEGSVLRDRRAAFGIHRSRDQERRDQESAARSEWSGWTRLSSVLNGNSGSEADRESFRTVQRLAQENLQWNRANMDTSASLPVTPDPSEGRDRAISLAEGWMGALEESMSGTRDALFFSEYAMDRLSHFPASKMKSLLDGEEIPLPLADQETEYVLYGSADPSRNIAAAYGEIFAFRLAARTLEGLVECRHMGHPLLVLAAALAYGIRNAVLDIRKLLQAGKVPLSKYVNIDTSYPDYLRLFLLLHGGSAQQMSRQIAAIENRTGISFPEAYTYVSGKGTASLKLWFFPGLLKMFGRTGQLGGSVKGNRYEVEYAADSSYQ